MPTLGSRVREARERQELTQEQLSEETGLSQDAITRLERDVTKKHQVADLVGLAKTLRVDLYWLLTGEGSMTRPAGDLAVVEGGVPAEVLEAVPDQELLDQVGHRMRGVTPIEVAAELTIIGDEEALAAADGNAWRDQYVALPLLRDEAAAGMGREIDDNAIDGYVILYRAWIDRPEDIRCLRVTGDSMAPILAERSIVAIDTASRVIEDLHGKMVAALTDDGGVTIKWLEVGQNALILKPENPTYRSIVVANHDRNPILGQVKCGWTWFG